MVSRRESSGSTSSSFPILIPFLSIAGMASRHPGSGHDGSCRDQMSTAVTAQQGDRAPPKTTQTWIARKHPCKPLRQGLALDTGSAQGPSVFLNPAHLQERSTSGTRPRTLPHNPPKPRPRWRNVSIAPPTYCQSGNIQLLQTCAGSEPRGGVVAAKEASIS